MKGKVNALLIIVALAVSMLAVNFALQSPASVKADGPGPECTIIGDCGCYILSRVHCRATNVYVCGTCEGTTLYCVDLAANLDTYENGAKYTWGGWGSDEHCGNPYWPLCQTTCNGGY